MALATGHRTLSNYAYIYNNLSY